jgi:hypothetical protein
MMHWLFIGLFLGFILHPVGKALLSKLRKKAEDI